MSADDAKSETSWLRRAIDKSRALFVGKNSAARDAYRERLAEEQRIYQDVADINVLPPIFHYWSHNYVRPLLETVGASNPDEFFANFLFEAAQRAGNATPRFVSVGAGNCDTEVRVAKLLRARGLSAFTIECLDMNPHMLARGREMAAESNVADAVLTVEADFNDWKPSARYDAVMANQSLHHVTNLEGLFDVVKRALDPRGYFVVSDMIGRNGHQRWPEALVNVHRFWQELPESYRYNQQLKRHESLYENWDCSREGFEGIRAQDILPLLIERYDFAVFIAFGNVVDVFVDRAFGHNFDADAPWDRDFIDRIHAFDEAELAAGRLTPTHLFAVLTPGPAESHRSARNLVPTACIHARS